MFVTTATEAAPGQLENEDRVLVRGPLVAVFDGVSQPSHLDSGCMHGAAWYVNMLAEHLAQAANTDMPLTDLLATAIAHTSAAHADTCDLSNPITPAASVGIIRETPASLDYLLLCDAYLVTDNGHEVTMTTDLRFAHAIADIRRQHLNGQTEYGSPAHENELVDVARQKQALTNTPAGYWIAAANPDAAHHAITGTLPLAGEQAIRRAALLTDGATRAVDTFALMDWRELLDMISQHGPHELIRRVRAAELADPTGAERPRFKRHDDATIAYATFTQERTT
ncbi:hypothetical protein [Allorhizocola rhizosphaerae]|uniref:hypothetical protein n=1 Tax=Allorhizocola rhizosphaerae TaxID=1872709 RepID=UPI000E3D642A|nr:hypothetical protein [Allorhizocola rhizosphaerae]